MIKNKRQNIKLITLAAILLVTLLMTRSFSIMNFVSVDEVNWLHRSATFYSGIKDMDFARTYVNPSPGVLTTWVGSLAFKIEFPQYRIARSSMLTSYSEFEKFIKWNGGNPLHILRTARVIMASFLICILIVTYYFAQRFFGLAAAFAGFMLIALDPFLAALTRTNHLDAPQAIFMFLSLMAILNYSFGGRRLGDLLVSGAAGGISILAKIPGFFIIPTVGILILVADFKSQKLEKSRDLKIYLRRVLKLVSPGLIWFLVLTIAIFALWPAMWVNPFGIPRQVFGVSSNFASTAVAAEDNRTPQKTAKSSVYYTRYIRGLYTRTSPIILFGIVFGIWCYLKRRTIFAVKNIRRGVLGLLLFAVIYFVGMTLPTKSSMKYLAPVFLAMDFFAGLGWYGLANELECLVKGKLSKVVPIVILTLAFSIQGIGIIDSFPYYFTYYNPMTGGFQAAAASGMVGVGEGLNLAGKYLADKPNSAELKVLSWYGEGPFSYYFDGRVGSVGSFDTSDRSWESVLERLQTVDYLVVYQNQKARNIPPELFEILAHEIPEFTAVIDGVEMAWVYKVSELDLPSFLP